ncbi:MAG: DUF1552 domain-containing protein [Myxococcota bacterium]|nr:DUF1552 domain-containing protein [Myxococcota bacterium]
MIITRRSMLRGLFAGGAVSLGLPTLEMFLNVNGDAFADGSSFPKRFVLWFWGNGVIPTKWTPETIGANWTPSEQLSALSDWTQDVSVITGFEVKVDNLKAHLSGPAGFFTGIDVKVQGDDSSFRAASLDQVIAQSIGGETVLRSLEVGIAPGVKGLSFNGVDSQNPPESDPVKLYQRLFGPTFTEPGEELKIDPKLALRRSVLSAVMDDANALRQRLGANDKQRLEQHLDAVRDIEARLLKLESAPPNFEGCTRPAEPVPDEYLTVDGRPPMPVRNAIMSDLISMAMACDLTRVVSVWHCDPVGDVLYPGATSGHHQLTHDEPGDQPQFNEIVKSIVSHFGTFVGSLKSVGEGDGTLLDNSVVLGCSDCGLARTHQIDEYPILVAGRGGGRLKTGLHVRSDVKDSASKVPLTVMQALGMPVTEYGQDGTHVSSGLSELEA